MPIADEKYVLFTTYKKDGTAVSTPVWIAALSDGRLGFTTDSDSWKVKRLKHNPAVQLQPCSMRGEATPGSVAINATAVAVADGTPEYAEVMRGIKRKYRVAMTALGVATRVQAMLGKGGGRGAILVTLGPQAPAS